MWLGAKKAVFEIINMIPRYMGTVYIGKIVEHIFWMHFVDKVCNDFHKEYTDPRKNSRV